MKLRFLLLPILAGLGIALPAAEPVPVLRSDLPLRAYAAQVVTTARPVLEFTLPEHAEPGNWGVSDFWGRPIGSGTTAAGIRTLQLPTPGPGHYRLTWTTAKEETSVPFSIVSADLPEASVSSPFGIGTHLAQGWEPDCVTLARAAGVSWIRDEAYWSAAESAKGKIDFQTVQTFPVWQGDSLQFGLARAVPASADTKVEFAAAFNAEGTGWIFPEGPPGFDTNTLRKHSRLRMKQEGSRSIYELEIPWKHLRFVRPQDGVFRFSFLANNNDGERRLGYLEWGSGIGRAKDPANYPVCVFVK